MQRQATTWSSSRLTRAGLWREVRDRLDRPGGALSGGQQQRLCIARSLAVQPNVLLMDEPCSALDPTSTRRIEETIAELRDEVTVVIVTHNMQQAQRVSDLCAFFLAEENEPGLRGRAGPDRQDVLDPRRRADARLRRGALRMTPPSRAAPTRLAPVVASPGRPAGRGRADRCWWPRRRSSADDAAINGSGSTYVALAMQQWVADAQTQGLHVNYTPTRLARRA